MSYLRRSAEPLLAAALFASGAVLLVLGARLTFLFDDWAFLLDRPGWNVHALLDPHNEHIALLPVTIYKVLLAIFGMGSAFPFRVVSTLLFLVAAVLLFVHLRRRVDQWLALGATVVVLFLGPGYEDLLWSFQMAFFGSMAAGLGMLLALQREDERGDAIACVLLAVSMAFSSLGLSFAAGAAVDIGTRAGRLRRAYVVVIPALLFAIWWLGWGHTADNAVSVHNLGLTPLFVANAIATGLSAMFGLSTPTPESLAPASDWTLGALNWGRPLLVGVVGLAGWRVYKLGRLPRWLWIVAAVGFSFWILAALNAKPGRTATAGRYQYVTVVFIVLIAAELLRGVRVGRRGLIAGGFALGAILLSNLTLLHQGYRTYRATSEIERADLTALDISRGIARPNFQVAQGLPFVLAGAQPYYQAEDDFGTPAYSVAGLAGAPEAARAFADQTLAAALRLKLARTGPAVPATGPAPVLKGPPQALLGRAAPCITVMTSESSAPLLVVPSGGVVLHSAGGDAEVRLRRYARTSLPVDLGRLRRGSDRLLAIPGDRSSVPWRLSLQGNGPVRACGLGAGG